MNTLKIIGIIIGVIIVIVLLALWYIGFFTKITINEREEGGYTVVGVEVVGPYNKVGTAMNQVDKELKEMGITCTKGFGIYYDNPQVTPAEKCRSFVGNVLEAKDSSRIQDLIAKNYKIDTIEKKQCLVIEFPVKNTISYMVGPMKAYPAFNKYIKEKNVKTGMCYELYDVPGKKTLFVMEKSK